jgi:diadenosine tetraphosphatase ApaH/serine/threonine PP2A family protein phosphatase
MGLPDAIHPYTLDGNKMPENADRSVIDFLHCEDDFGGIVVHGRTPVQQPDIRHNRINIDTGAYATGRLTCLVLQDDNVSLL